MLFHDNLLATFVLEIIPLEKFFVWSRTPIHFLFVRCIDFAFCQLHFLTFVVINKACIYCQIWHLSVGLSWRVFNIIIVIIMTRGYCIVIQHGPHFSVWWRWCWWPGCLVFFVVNGCNGMAKWTNGRSCYFGVSFLPILSTYLQDSYPIIIICGVSRFFSLFCIALAKTSNQLAKWKLGGLTQMFGRFWWY